MPNTAENLWHFNAVTPGQQGPQTQVTLTPQNIAQYAQAALCPNPRYHAPNPAAPATSATPAPIHPEPVEGHPQPATPAPIHPELVEGYPRPQLAMPTMILSYAPLLREEIAEANGYTALEQSQTARRQTPFAKCEIRWHIPVSAGDTITASRRVLEKYERRGSRFVTFQVQARNQQNQPAAEYDYTCIFDYAQVQRQRPDPASPPPSETAAAPSSPQQTETGHPPLLTIQTAQPGTPLTPLSITESQETINRRSAFRLAGRPNESNIHTDEEFARQNIFGAIVNSGPATMSYIDQMLQQSFPPEALYHGGRLLMRAITPFRSQDTVTFTGQITAQNPTQNTIECQIQGTNQRQELVCLAQATLHPT